MNESVSVAFWPRLFLWLLLASPGAFWLQGYLRGELYYGEFLHTTGQFSAQLLIATLAVTPLRRLFSRMAWTAWLVRQRRYLGVAAFGYALPHALAYLVKLASLQRIASEAIEPGLATGWLALLLMAPLAATSLDAAVRRLGRRWKQLHRLVYPAAALTLAHWVLTAFDPTAGLVHAAILVMLVSLRLVVQRRRRLT
ncbi:MAG: hypothetical protein HKN58_06785 [Xanthomonadales bacterium]|nr:hypothetical protein [Xanthomonadales bacterium]